MEDSITIRHELSCFSVTSEPEICTTGTGKDVYITKGVSTAPVSQRCPECGSVMHRCVMSNKNGEEFHSISRKVSNFRAVD